jgi:hypothetical protein
MLFIRSSQLEQLSAPHSDSMLDTICRYIAQRYPGRSGDDTRLAIVSAIERGRSYGIATSAGLGAFAALCFAVSARFDEHPKVRAILEGTRPGTEDLTPDARVEALGSILSDADWQQVQDTAS